MNFRNFKPYNASELSALYKAFKTKIELWSKEWFSEADITFTVDNAYSISDEDQKTFMEFECRGGESLKLVLDKTASLGLTASLLGNISVGSIDGSDEYQKLNEKAVESLMGQFTAVSGNASEGTSLMGRTFDFGEGWLAICIKIDNIELMLFSSLEYNQTYIKSVGYVARERVALQPRPQSILNEDMTVVASLGTVELSVGEVNQLAIGDVVTLNHGFADPIHIASIDGRPIAKGMLGQSEGNKALHLLKDGVK